MAKTKLKDFIEIDYIGKIKETNQIFDLTNEDLAKKENLYNENLTYGSKIICLGENQILSAIDKFLTDKEINKTYTLELKPEEAFGKKENKLINIISSEILTKQNIRPFPGLQINASGVIGKIISVTGGRVTIDFNHPLAGKNLIYEIKINKIITSDEEKLKSLIENTLNLNNKEYEIKIENNKAAVTIKPKIPAKVKEQLKSKVKELIPSLEIIYS